MLEQPGKLADSSAAGLVIIDAPGTENKEILPTTTFTMFLLTELRSLGCTENKWDTTRLHRGRPGFQSRLVTTEQIPNTNEMKFQKAESLYHLIALTPTI